MVFKPIQNQSSDWQALQTGLRRFVQTRVKYDAVDDVVSDILEAIIRNKSGLANASNPSAWIYACARSKVVDHYRRTGRERHTLDAYENDPTTLIANDGDETVNPTDLHDCLAGLINGMSFEDRTILHEIDLNQTRQTDFAAKNTLALPTVKSRVQRARKRLRDRLIACCPDCRTYGCQDTCNGTSSGTAT